VTFRRLVRELLAPAPDPRPAHRRAESVEAGLLEDLRDALEVIAAGRSRLATRTAGLRDRVIGLEADARQALAEGREDEARRTLERRHAVAGELELLETQLQAAEREADRLAIVERELSARIEAASMQGRMLEARRSAAAIHVRIGEALAGISTEIDDFAPELARAEQRAEELEARAAALDQLLGLTSRAEARQ
jgi:phage shock protein A